MNNSKDKKLKNLNYKLLYMFPLVGIGITLTQQNVNAMFPKKQPTYQTSSTSKSTVTTTSTTTSRLSTSTLSSQSNLGTKPKTNTISVTSTGYNPTTEDLQKMKISGNLGDSLKILTEKAFYDKLESKISSKQQDFDEITNNLSRNVKDVSSSIFNRKIYDEAYKTSKFLSSEDMKKINEASEDFSESMSGIVLNKFKNLSSNFDNININTDGIDKTFENTRIMLNIIGDDVKTATDHSLKTQVNKFINSQE